MHIHRYMLIICIAILLTLPGCFVPSRYLMRKNLFIPPSTAVVHPCLCSAEQPLTITLWIHGTRLFSRPLYHEQFNSQPGLAHIDEINRTGKIHTIAHALIASDPYRFAREHFYIFGWSGQLCFEEREKAAHILHKKIEDLLTKYKAEGLNPRIRIMGHSHGGNVALNLAQLDCTFTVDELILLACPVQSKTKHLVKQPLFKQVYALYSALDIVQILDPQGMYKHKNKASSLFSKRQFLHQENLAQMKVKINRRAITHSEFAKKHFLKLLPYILDGIDQWHDALIYTHDPNSMCKLLCVYTDRLNTKRSPSLDRATI